MKRTANYIEGLVAENNAASTDKDDYTCGNAANNTTTRDATTT